MSYALWDKCLWKRIRAMAFVVLLGAALSPLIQSSQDVKDAKPNPKDQAEWVSAGFKFGWMSFSDAGKTSFDEKQVGGLLSFRYSRHCNGLDLTTLPMIAVPFGLFLDDAPIDDMFLQGLARFQQVRFLCLRFGPITDTGMKEIAKLKDLTHLEVSRIGNRANVEDAAQAKDFNDGIKHFADLTKLVVLNLSETRIGNDGINHLAKMKKLRVLNLRATKIADAGLEALTGLTELTTLDVRDTEITKDGVERLRKALPKVKILFEKG
ncbi:MAG: hypothetical protein K2X38_17260 [Gemmataceae bacterium]|nr:hypothetical protein [Gemmataceae bacterium]